MKEKGNKNKDREEQTGDENYSESMRTKSFCCTFSFINYFKRKRVIRVKACWGGM